MIKEKKELEPLSDANPRGPFIELLQKYEVYNPERFSCIKNPGGTFANGDSYVADIMYFIKDRKIQRIFVPYITGKKSIEKQLGKNELEALYDETYQETGIQIVTDESDLILRRELESFEDNNKKHSQAFYLNKVNERTVEKYLREFKGFNYYDPDKGMPIVVPIHEAYPFLPTNHLVAEIESIPVIIRRFHQDNAKSESIPFSDTYKLLLMDMKDELKRRSS